MTLQYWLFVFAFGCHPRGKWLKDPIRTHGYTPLSFRQQRNSESFLWGYVFLYLTQISTAIISLCFGWKSWKIVTHLVIAGFLFVINERLIGQ